jgi:2'-5' RNA ligase
MFVAVECGEEIAARAAAVIRDLEARAAELAPAARLTTAAPDRLHLTVRFIGEVAAATAEAVDRALSPPLPVPPFVLRMAGFGAFPARGAPRVIWAGVASGLGPLRALEREISDRLSPLGIPPEARPYAPHLTLARVREAAGLRTADLLAGLPPAGLGSAQVDAITLFESRLSPRGAAYTVLRRVPLVPPV